MAGDRPNVLSTLRTGVHNLKPAPIFPIWLLSLSGFVSSELALP